MEVKAFTFNKVVTNQMNFGTFVLVVVGVTLAHLFLTVDGFGSKCKTEDQFVLNGSLINNHEATTTNLKVAFFGDQGVRSSSREALHLVKDWGAEIIIHIGDFDYIDDPDAWVDQLNSIVGEDYPYFAVIGNHDVLKRPDYLRHLINRLGRINATSYCSGELGVKYSCNYKGLLFALSAVGTYGNRHVEFLDSTFALNPAVWRICGWHKNQHDYQTGDKEDEVGWEAYQTCLKHGAIVATAHEHSYSRSYLMSDFENKKVASTDGSTLPVQDGNSFVFVSGLGGESIRPWKNGAQKNPWWAATAASNVGVQPGALLCVFNDDGNQGKASCEFRDTDNTTWDSFNILSRLSQRVPLSQPVTKLTSLELQVTNTIDDATFDGVRLQSHLDYLTLGGDSISFLRFEGFTASIARRVRSAHLHLLDAKKSVFESESQPVFRIVGLHPSAPEQFSESFLMHQTRQSIVWQDSEGFESGEIWVSPNLVSLISELASYDNFATETLTFAISGQSASIRTVFSSDAGPCLSPTLFLQLENQPEL